MAQNPIPFRIVVGVDGSEASIEALRVAQRMATVLKTELVAAGFWEYPSMRSARITLGSIGQEAGAKIELDAAVDAAFGPARPDNVRIELRFGPADIRLIDAGSTAQMLVVGRRGHGGINGLLVGSVSSACARHAQCPVLVVREPLGQANGTTFESWSQVMATQWDAARIVVGVDGSPSSVRALREASRIATALGGRVEAIACWDYPSIWAAPYPLAGGDFQGEAEDALRVSLDEAFGGEMPANLSSRVIQTQVRPGLIEASRDATMLVVGRRGSGGFSGLNLGSVSAACIGHALCPVLVVHAGLAMASAAGAAAPELVRKTR